MAGIDSGIALGDSIAKYPLNADEQQEIELWLNIRAFSFTRLKALRTLEIGEQKCNMWLPMPTKMETGTSISYNSGQANEGKLTKAINSVASIGSIGDLFTGVVGWFESVTGVANAIGKRDMDQRESVFNGAGACPVDCRAVPRLVKEARGRPAVRPALHAGPARPAAYEHAGGLDPSTERRTSPVEAPPPDATGRR